MSALQSLAARSAVLNETARSAAGIFIFAEILKICASVRKHSSAERLRILQQFARDHSAEVGNMVGRVTALCGGVVRV